MQEEIEKKKKEIKDSCVNQKEELKLTLQYDNPEEAEWLEQTEECVLDIEEITSFSLSGYATKLILRLGFDYQEVYQKPELEKGQDFQEWASKLVCSILNFAQTNCNGLGDTRNALQKIEKMNKEFIFCCEKPEQIAWIDNMETITIGKSKKIVLEEHASRLITKLDLEKEKKELNISCKQKEALDWTEAVDSIDIGSFSTVCLTDCAVEMLRKIKFPSPYITLIICCNHANPSLLDNKDKITTKGIKTVHFVEYATSFLTEILDNGTEYIALKASEKEQTTWIENRNKIVIDKEIKQFSLYNYAACIIRKLGFESAVNKASINCNKEEQLKWLDSMQEIRIENVEKLLLEKHASKLVTKLRFDKTQQTLSVLVEEEAEMGWSKELKEIELANLENLCLHMKASKLITLLHPETGNIKKVSVCCERKDLLWTLNYKPNLFAKGSVARLFLKQKKKIDENIRNKESSVFEWKFKEKTTFWRKIKNWFS